MALDAQIKTQLAGYLDLMEGPVTIKLSVGSDATSEEMAELVHEIASMTDRIQVVHQTLHRTPSFQVGDRITFAGVPMGHEFTSLIMAILQVSGRKPKIDDATIAQIKAITDTYDFTTYISLSCHNCPDVVQALNIMAVLNPRIRHTMVDGAAFKEEVDAKNIMAVPYVEQAGQSFGSGRMTVEEILAKLGTKPDQSQLDGEQYDVVVIGGGPAGASAAIYAARKGIRTAILAERFGGQVADTLGIENLIGTKYTEGPRLVADLEAQVREYAVDIHRGTKVTGIARSDGHLNIVTEGGATIHSKTAIIATGARWRNLGVPGEAELKNRGVAYCPHCDGPLFKGKRVAVVGGGNSGVEAAIDLAGIVEHVILIEYGSELRADKVLQDRLRSLKNTEVITNAQTTRITGDTKVDGIRYIDRATDAEHHLELQGVFVQIGLVPNTEWLGTTVLRQANGEVHIDANNATTMRGVFAAGDCTTEPYKQIIVSMGAGATAALSAFDYIIRN